jgi:hypothetical protein
MLGSVLIVDEPPFQLSGPFALIVAIPSRVIICVNAVTSDLLQSAQAHRIREMAYKHLQNSC